MSNYNNYNNDSDSSKRRPNKRHKPFNVLFDKTRERHYLAVPKHLKSQMGEVGAKLSSKVKSEMEAESLRLRAHFADQLHAPSVPKSNIDNLMEQCRFLGCLLSPEEIIQQKLDVLNLLAQEKTLEDIREDLAAMLDNEHERRKQERLDSGRKLSRKDLKKSAGAKLIRMIELPWKNKKLAEFTNRKLREKAILEVEKFLDDQYDFLTGKPWSAATRIGWIGRFLQIVDRAIHRQETELEVNFFRRALRRKRGEINPYNFDLEKLQIFTTYIRHWESELYVPFVLGTWGCMRVAEITVLTWDKIDLEKGQIQVDEQIKDCDVRTIYEADVPHLFKLLRDARSLIGTGKKPVVTDGNWSNRLFRAYRELFVEPWPSNVMRSSGASALLVKKGMAVCGQVMGHMFLGIDRTLLNFYKAHVTIDYANAFFEIEPEAWCDEIETRYKWLLYMGWNDPSLSTAMWPNFLVQTQHYIGMASPEMTDLLRRKRPIFAEAVGRDVRIEVLNLNATRQSYIVHCRSERAARKITHRIRVAVYTAQGVINFETGEVTHYERNYGPCLGQRLFRLVNGEQLEEQILAKRLGVCEVARLVGTSVDMICRYIRMGEPKNRVRYMPESQKTKLEALFEGLLFEPVEPPSDPVAWICAGAPALKRPID